MSDGDVFRQACGEASEYERGFRAGRKKIADEIEAKFLREDDNWIIAPTNRMVKAIAKWLRESPEPAPKEEPCIACGARLESCPLAEQRDELLCQRVTLRTELAKLSKQAAALRAELAPVFALAEKASKALWSKADIYGYIKDVDGVVIAQTWSGGGERDDEPDFPKASENRALIVAAVNVLPRLRALLAAIETP